MCGILGKVTFSGRHESAVEFTYALNQLINRGPDDSGVFEDCLTNNRRISLGHRRLSILDLSDAGHQPMISPSSGTVCVYNGEIYNFKDIRNQLRALGHEFHSECDTEVVIAAYDEWGSDFLDQFIGMFAVAIYDPKRQRLLLARDRLGIKPLYLYSDGNQLAFSSEVSALAALPTLKLEVRPDAVHHLLLYGYIPAPLSIYRNVEKIKPGHKVVVDLSDQKTVHQQYWDAVHYYARPANFRSEEEVVEAITAELKDAVNRRLISDVPIGAFLSGGIDSSLIAAFMQELSSSPIKTFTIGFSDSDFDEAPYAKRMAEYLGTEHTELYIDEHSVLDIAQNTSNYFDEPFADTSAVPTLALSRMTRQHVTVALSGDGGDELFWGYNNYAFASFRRYDELRNVPRSLRLIAAQILQLLPSNAMQSRGFQLKFRDFVEFYLRNHQLSLKVMYPGLHPCNPEFEDILDTVNRRIYERLENIPRDSVTGAMDLHTYLPDDILAKVDRATMSVGLEARVPMLDHNVVQLAASIPTEYKTRNGQLKYLLRLVLSQQVPQDIWDRPKKGFGIPISRWLRTSLRDWAHEELFSSETSLNSWIDKSEMRRAFSDHQEGRVDNKRLIWAGLQLSGWDQRMRRIRLGMPING
jgi:asparagine synthase (glutamine-hydrolysing)